MKYSAAQIASIIAQRDRYKLALSLQRSAADAVANVRDDGMFDHAINCMINEISAYRAAIRGQS